MSDADDPPQSCAGVEVRAEPLPIDLFAVIDASSSMRQATASGESKWSATKAAFRSFLEAAEPSMGFGLSLFPLPQDRTASCDSVRYGQAALPIDTVSNLLVAALAELDAVEPHGQTPLAPALNAALELARRHAAAHPERSVVVVLASDGLPTTCAPTDAASLAALVQAAYVGPAHVRTLIVAPSALTGSVEQAGFAALARAGGTGQPVTMDPTRDFSEQLGGALDRAAARQVACDLAIPAPPSNERLDYDAVNVAFASAGGSFTFPRVTSGEACDARGGWFYDADPRVAPPSRINMCPGSCERLSAMGAGKLRLELGCKTVVR